MDLPPNAQIHDTFHVSYLKKAHGSDWQLNPLPSSVEDGPIVEPMVILERRMVKRGNQVAAQLLVQWKHSTPEKATWEFAFEI